MSLFVVSAYSNIGVRYKDPLIQSWENTGFCASVIFIPQGTDSQLAFLRAPKKCIKGHLAYIFYILILTSSDYHPNPGPRTPKYPCGICGKAVRWSRTIRSVACNDCEVWFHKDCLGMSTAVYEPLEATDVSWYCCNCGIPNFHSRLFNETEIDHSSLCHTGGLHTPSNADHSSLCHTGGLHTPSNADHSQLCHTGGLHTPSNADHSSLCHTGGLHTPSNADHSQLCHTGGLHTPSNADHWSLYLHSIRCFPSLRNEKRHCWYNIITTISHVISSEGIHGTEKYVWSRLLLLLKIPEIHLDSHFKVSEWT